MAIKSGFKAVSGVLISPAEKSVNDELALVRLDPLPRRRLPPSGLPPGLVTSPATGPRSPCLSVNSTSSPTLAKPRRRPLLAAKLVWWRKMSGPPQSSSMNPNPRVVIKNLTLPRVRPGAGGVVQMQGRLLVVDCSDRRADSRTCTLLRSSCSSASILT